MAVETGTNGANGVPGAEVGLPGKNMGPDRPEGPHGVSLTDRVPSGVPDLIEASHAPRPRTRTSTATSALVPPRLDASQVTDPSAVRVDDAAREKPTPEMLATRRDEAKGRVLAAQQRLATDKRLDDDTRGKLAAEITAGNAKVTRALQDLTVAAMPQAEYAASKAAAGGDEYGIALSDAFWGIARAADRFNPRKGKFESFMQDAAEHEIQRGKRDRADKYAVPPPRTITEKVPAIMRSHAALTQRLNRNPRPEEVAEHSGVDLEVVTAFMYDEVLKPARSLDEPMFTGTKYGDIIPDGQPDMGNRIADIELLGEIMAELPERERTVVVRRVYDDMTQSQIGEEVGYSQMHVSRILRDTFGLMGQTYLARSVPPEAPSIEAPSGENAADRERKYTKILDALDVKKVSSPKDIVTLSDGEIPTRAEAWLLLQELARSGAVMVRGEGADAKYIKMRAFPDRQELKDREQKYGHILDVLEKQMLSSTQDVVDFSEGAVPNKIEAWFLLQELVQTGAVVVNGQGADARYTSVIALQARVEATAGMSDEEREEFNKGLITSAINQEGRISSRALVNRTGLTDQDVTRQIKALTREGYIHTARSGGDVFCFLTPQPEKS